MKKALLTIALTLALALPALAVTDYGQQCYELTPFADILTFSLVQPDGPTTMLNLTVDWRGATTYQLTGNGTATIHLQPTHEWFVGAHFVNSSTAFSNNRSCAFWAQLGESNTWTFTCTGNNPPFNNSGTFTSVPCDAAVVSLRSSTLAGQP